MKVTSFRIVVGVILVPFVILPVAVSVVAAIGAVLMHVAFVAYTFPVAACCIGLVGGPCIILGVVRWLNLRAVDQRAESPAGTPDPTAPRLS